MSYDYKAALKKALRDKQVSEDNCKFMGVSYDSSHDDAIINALRLAMQNAEPETVDERDRLKEINKDLLDALLEASSIFDNYPDIAKELIGTHEVVYKAIIKAQKEIDETT